MVLDRFLNGKLGGLLFLKESLQANVRMPSEETCEQSATSPRSSCGVRSWPWTGLEHLWRIISESALKSGNLASIRLGESAGVVSAFAPGTSVGSLKGRWKQASRVIAKTNDECRLLRRRGLSGVDAGQSYPKRVCSPIPATTA